MNHPINRRQFHQTAGAVVVTACGESLFSRPDGQAAEPAGFEWGDTVSRQDYGRLFKAALAPYEAKFPDDIIDYCIYGTAGEATGLINPCTLGRWAFFETQMHRLTGDSAYLKRARDLLMHNLEAIAATPKSVWDYPLHEWESAAGRATAVARIKKAGARALWPGSFSPPLSLGLPCFDVESVDGWENHDQRRLAKTVMADIADYRIAPDNYYKGDNDKANNRSLTSARGVIMIARAFPEHPRAEIWKKWAEKVIGYSLAKPSQEDSLGYQADWFHSILAIIEAFDMDPKMYREPMHRGYFEHIKTMMAPAGEGIGYGDGGNFHSALLPILEKGAAVFGDGEYRYQAIAHLKRNYGVLFSGGHTIHGVLWRWMDAGRWCDDSVTPVAPKATSVITHEKKLVMRSGQSTLAVTSYDGGSHGHFDANAICKFVHGDAVLLGDGGYRFKAPLSHNRLLWRTGKPDGPLLDHFRRTETVVYTPASGKTVFSKPGPAGGVDKHWKPGAREMCVEFLADFPEFTIARTNLNAQRRTIILDRNGRCLLFDNLRSETEVTAANVLYFRDVLSQGEAWVRGRNSQHEDLVVQFLSPARQHMESQIRNKRTETAVYSVRQGSFPGGNWFVTVLSPAAPDHDTREVVSPIKFAARDSAQIVTISQPDDTPVLYACQSNNRSLMQLPGGIETDALAIRLTNTTDGLHATLVRATRLNAADEKLVTLPEPDDRRLTIPGLKLPKPN